MTTAEVPDLDLYSLRLRWPDGVQSTSYHRTAQLLVRYLTDLHRQGEDVEVVSLNGRRLRGSSAANWDGMSDD
jgi:hypothetical protein